jgi:peptidoglycan/LPS O-acetylase OafA/YrhL
VANGKNDKLDLNFKRVGMTAFVALPPLPATLAVSHNDVQAPPYRDEIGGLRALAVISVVVFHAARGVLPGGFVGVDIFFVISGYLISRILFSEMAKGRILLSDFYAKRVRRIFPALILVLVSVWAAGWLLLDPFEFDELGKEQIGASLFTLNFRLMQNSGYFDIKANARILLHLWSLSIEEQFYIVWPILLIALTSLRRVSARLFFFVLASLFALSLGWSVILTASNETHAFFLPTSRAFELLLGAMVAFREDSAGKLSFRMSVAAQNFAVVAGLTLMIGGILLLDESQPFPGWRALAPTFGCALVLASPGSSFAALPLRLRPLRLIGDISYPLYLWHWPLLAFANVRLAGGGNAATRLLLMGLAAGLAFLTWNLLEKNVARIFLRRRIATVSLLTLGLIGTAIAGGLTTGHRGVPERFPPKIADIFRFKLTGAAPAAPIPPACFDNLMEAPLFSKYDRASLLNGVRSSGCLASIDPHLPTIAVIGDSHGEHLLGGLANEFAGAANIVNLAAKYCVPLVEHVEAGKGRGGTQRCALINELRLELVRKIKPDVVVVGAYFLSYEADPVWIYPDYLHHFVSGLATMREAGAKQIIVAGEVPTWAPSAPGLVARAQMAGTDAARTFEGLQKDSLAMDTNLKSLSWPDGVHYASQVDRLCNEQGCLRRVGETLPDDIVAYDYGHFSGNGSAYTAHNILGPAIRTALALKPN